MGVHFHVCVCVCVGRLRKRDSEIGISNNRFNETKLFDQPGIRSFSKYNNTRSYSSLPKRTMSTNVNFFFFGEDT